MSKISYYLRLIFSSIKRRGVINTYRYIVSDVFFDLKYRTNTNGVITGDNLKGDITTKQHATDYQPANSFVLKKIFEKLKKELEGGVFVDIGSGKGRVLIAAAEYGAKKVIGIEFDRGLVIESEKNIKQFLTRNHLGTKVELINKDAREVELTKDVNIVFLYNPFDGILLGEVLKKNKLKSVSYIYVNPVHRNIFEENGFNIKDNMNDEVLIFEYNG